MTISIGAVVAQPCNRQIDPECAIDALIDQADRALYVAKTAGRNRITLAQPAA